MLPLLGLLATLASPLPGPDTLVYSGRDARLDVRPPRMESVQIDIDGDLDEPVWAEAAVLSGFTQYEPVEGVVPEEATEVRVFYTGDAIYFGIHAFDAHPDRILARLGERDRVVFNDDWLRIMLDTYDDQRQAYVFYVNPLGLQTDGLWIEGLQRGGPGGGGGGISIDFNPNFIWESDGHVVDDGWTAEIRIPYVSLRFREIAEQDWGIQVAREVKRKGFKQSWAPLTQEISSTLAQSGRLVGLRDLHPRRLVEVKPVLTGRRTGSDETGAFLRSDPDGDFGLDGRVGVTQNLVLDATYNPDFSQIEADAGQIAVNERFALFFPEKRSFFLEGMEIFNTPQRLVYTRRIGDPVAGAKLTGKVGSFQIGYIGAVDESPSTLLGGTGNAVFNIVRARRDVGAGSTVGVLYTDRTLTNGSGAFNRVLGGDARLVFGGRYTVTTQLAGSLTRTEGDFDDGGIEPLAALSVARGGRAFTWNVDLADIAPGFVGGSGFITRAGDTEANAAMNFSRFGRPGALLERASVRVTTNNFFRHDDFWNGDLPFESEIELWPSFSFRGGRSVTFVLRRGYFRFEEDDYASYEILGEDGTPRPFQLPGALTSMDAWGMLPNVRINNALQLGGQAFFREVPIFDEAVLGYEMRVGPNLQYRPTSQLQLEANYTYSKIWRRHEGRLTATRPSSGIVDGVGSVTTTTNTRTDTEFSTVNIPRLRIQYQFNEALFVRAVGQYALEERAALTDPTTGRPILIGGAPVPERSTGEFQGQLLVQYEPSPGTIFYVGFSRLMEGRRTLRLSALDPVQEGLFVKLSYLFRM